MNSVTENTVNSQIYNAYYLDHSKLTGMGFLFFIGDIIPLMNDK